MLAAFAASRLLRGVSAGNARLPARQRLPRADATVNTTLLDLVQTIGEITDDETEIVATVIHMLRSGSVKLTGSFRDTPTDQLLD